jgi:cholesterol oxidase
MRLLFRCRDITQSLSKISPCLGELVRTNSEALLGVVSRSRKTDYSEGIAITSFFMADEVTAIEPVRYPAGSSLMRFLAGPLVESGGSILSRFAKTAAQIFASSPCFARISSPHSTGTTRSPARSISAIGLPAVLVRKSTASQPGPLTKACSIFR